MDSAPPPPPPPKWNPGTGVRCEEGYMWNVDEKKADRQYSKYKSR